MIGKVFAGVILIFLLLGAFRDPIIDGVKSWRTDGGDTKQVVLVITEVAVTSADIVLDKDLYQSITSSVNTITSTEISDTPVATAYNEDTRKLTIGGLKDGTSRNLTVSYLGETDNVVMRVMGPFLLVLLFGGLIGAIIWSIFEGKKHRRFH